MKDMGFVKIITNVDSSSSNARHSWRLGNCIPQED